MASTHVTKLNARMNYLAELDLLELIESVFKRTGQITFNLSVRITDSNLN